MHSYETCNLGSVNLNSDFLMDRNGLLDMEKLYITVRTGVEILDRVINLLVFPDEKMRQVSLDARRIGLGVTGWADYLERIGMTYDSDEARMFAAHLSRYITATAEEKSRELAKELGPCKYSKEFRNLSVTCIAPTGGITGLMGLRGYAIEPFFEEATKLNYRAHIDMQAAWQSGMHNAVSKTVNLAADASVEMVHDAYTYAASRGCKGITIYRDLSKFDQPRSLGCAECESGLLTTN
jgi:ribonucleoside-diphosphate reductase alpha chain